MSTEYLTALQRQCPVRGMTAVCLILSRASLETDATRGLAVFVETVAGPSPLLMSAAACGVMIPLGWASQRIRTRRAMLAQPKAKGSLWGLGSSMTWGGTA